VTKPRVLVTGGCGFIGSHTIIDLIEHGYEVVSVDNGINSSFDVLTGVEAITGVSVPNIDVDLSQAELALREIGKYGPFQGIIHFAALKRVEESVIKPLWYYRNNVGSTITTLALMEELNIPHLIFSSSCTVYGAPASLPVTEDTPFTPAESPYGATKQAGEILYGQYFINTPRKSGISLRYFNPAGAHPSAIIGESSLQPSTNLVPVITETAIGVRNSMMVYGTDYNTRDGSCMRDYIHVMDLARAHTLAMDYILAAKNKSAYEIFNLGIGEGVTVLEAIHAFENTTGVKVNYQLGPRRSGDVPAIYADHSLITSRMGWKPEHDIADIMRTAWAWEQVRRQPTGI
jgi:UDP-glucose 4-epimerase